MNSFDERCNNPVNVSVSGTNSQERELLLTSIAADGTTQSNNNNQPNDNSSEKAGQ